MLQVILMKIWQLVEVLPHDARDPDLVLTLVVVCMEFAHSSCVHVGFL